MNKKDKAEIFSDDSLYNRILDDTIVWQSMLDQYIKKGNNVTSIIERIQNYVIALSLAKSLYKNFCDGKVKFNTNGFVYPLYSHVSKEDLTEYEWNKYLFARTLDMFFSKYSTYSVREFGQYKYLVNTDVKCQLSGRCLALFYKESLDEFIIGQWYHKGKQDVSLAPCEFKQNQDYQVTIDVPSGQIVFVNDIRKITTYDEQRSPRCQEFSPSHFSGVLNNAKWFQERNMVYMQISNCACDVGVIDNQHLVVGGNFDEVKRGWQSFKKVKAKQVGSICTDLWAYCACDKDLFEKMRKEKNVEIKAFYNPVFVKVTPGKYTFKHQFESSQSKKSNIYTWITLVKE